MADFVIAEMTRREAEEAVNQFVSQTNAMRWLLLEMFERRAHKALGYGDFETFAKERLNINLADRTIANHLAAARVERNVIGAPEKDADSASFRIPVSAALELNKLPETEQASAWKEVKSLESYGTHLPKDIARALRDIVTRRLNKHALSPVKSTTIAPFAPIASIPVAPVVPRPKPNMTTLVPATYDRGEEFDDVANEQESVSASTPAAPVEQESVFDAPAVMDDDAALCAAVAFMRQYITAYKSADRNAFDELFRDAVRFLKEYGA